MHDLKVVVSCTRRAGLLPMYEEQLRAAGIPFTCLNLAEMPNNNMGNLGYKLETLRWALEKNGECKKVVATDAWDILFYGAAEEVFNKIPDKGVMLAAERNCFPDAYLADSFHGETPWRFVNGGPVTGTPDEIYRWTRAIEAHPCYHPAYIDQQFLNQRLLDKERALPFALDSRTDLFYCYYMEMGEMQPRGGRPFNAVTGTRPNFMHFNGKADPTMFLWKLAQSAGTI